MSTQTQTAKMAGNPTRKTMEMEMENETATEETCHYHDKCPGCKIDKFKDTNTAIPYKLFGFVAVVVLAAALPISSLFPFIYFMIRDFHIAKREEDISFYAGLVGSSLLLGRALTSVLWGIIADRYGRKPVLVIGLISIIIFNTLFGLSTQFWMAFSTRFLLGTLCGIFGAIRAYASEVSREEHKALGMSIICTSWGIGLVIGPALGGFLAQPADKYPHLFSKESLFGRFPYLLPCLTISVFTLAVLVATLWLPESLHKHNDDKKTKPRDDDVEVEDTEKGSDAKPEKSPTSLKSLLRNWPLMSSILAYCVFQVHDLAYTEIFPLWATSPRKFEGLGYSTSDVGKVLAISGFGLFLFQLFLFPLLEKACGPIMIARIGAVLTVALLSSYPLIAKLSGISLTITLDFASVLKNVISVSISTGWFLLQNRAVSQEQRGAANGISMSLSSVFKAVGPFVGGTILSWAQKRQHAPFIPGAPMVFFILNALELAALLTTFKPFLALPRKDLS